MKSENLLLLPLTENLRGTLESVGTTHLISGGYLIDHPLIMNEFEGDSEPQNSFFLIPYVLAPVSENIEPDEVNYSRIPLTEIRIGYPLSSQRLKDMYDSNKPAFYVLLGLTV